VASAIGGVQNLVVEDREVKGQTKADGVGGGQLCLGDIGGVLKECTLAGGAREIGRASCGVGGSHLVSLVSSGSGGLALLAGSELGKVTVVVTLPVRGY
jgi:hypothetical protein